MKRIWWWLFPPSLSNLVAIHEAGHVLATLLLGGNLDAVEIGDNGGKTWGSVPRKNIATMLMSGAAAEKMTYGRVLCDTSDRLVCEKYSNPECALADAEALLVQHKGLLLELQQALMAWEIMGCREVQMITEGVIR